MIQLKRTYDPPARGDGRRILVERLWPRGLKKQALAADVWVKEVAPSATLRKWFDHRVERWAEFRRRYRKELDSNPGAWEPILDASKRGRVTLLYSARDTLHNGALVLRDYLAKRDSGHRHRDKRAGPPLKKAAGKSMSTRNAKRTHSQKSSLTKARQS